MLRMSYPTSPFASALNQWDEYDFEEEKYQEATNERENDAMHDESDEGKFSRGMDSPTCAPLSLDR